MPEPSAPAGRSSGGTLARIGAMMFLEYWSLGLWYVTVTTFIAANTGSAGEGIFSAGFIGYSGAASAVGALVAPTLFGWVADRLFAAERVLGLLHFGAAISLYVMHAAESQLGFFVGMLLYFQAFCPTVTLTNTISLGRLANRDGEYPVVRLFGTCGWMAAGIFVGVVCPVWLGYSVEGTRLPLAVAAWSHVAMACYSFCLPPSTTARQAARATRPDLASLARWRPSSRVVWFLVISMLAATTSQAYNVANPFLNHSGYQGAAAWLTLGQLTEFACLAAMPWMQSRVRLKTLFLIGILAWSLRYVLLAAASFGEPTSGALVLVVGAILLHGPAYAFVYIIGSLYIDKLVEPRNRGVGQGLHTLATNGVGHLLGAGMVGWSQSVFLTPAGVDPAPYDWAPFWLTPVALGLVVAAAFAARFTEAPPSDAGPLPTDPPSIDEPAVR